MPADKWSDAANAKGRSLQFPSAHEAPHLIELLRRWVGLSSKPMKRTFAQRVVRAEGKEATIAGDAAFSK